MLDARSLLWAHLEAVGKDKQGTYFQPDMHPNVRYTSLIAQWLDDYIKTQGWDR